jgi:large subunit ribosomal protein L16
MTLMPKKTRFRKVQRGTMAGRPRGRAGELVFGDFGLQSLEPVWLTAQQIEAARISMSRKMKKAGKLTIRPFPDKAVTKKPAETRMGKGKGNPEFWVAVVKRNCMVFEISGVEEAVAREIFEAARYKLPMKVRFVKKESEKSL